MESEENASFVGLPIELQATIIREIKLPSQLKNLCLVSKAISVLATEQLYMSISLECNNKEATGKWIQSISNNSKGLRSTRILRINGTIDVSTFGLFRRLLFTLRRDFLLRFEYNKSFRPPNRMMEFLWRHQKNLRNVNFHGIRGGGLIEFLVVHKDSLQLPRSIAELEVGEAAMEKAHQLPQIIDPSRLTQLTLSSYIVFDATNLNIILSYNLHRLAHLKFHEILFSRNVIVHLGDLPSLAHLSLMDCMGKGPILDAYRKPTLKHLHIYNSCPWDNQNPYPQLSCMLHRFQGLESLVVCANQNLSMMTAAHLAAGVEIHKDTLEGLFISESVFEPAESQEEEFISATLYNVAKKCKKLFRLALPFGRSRTRENCEDLVGNLPHLVTMGIGIRMSLKLEQFPYAFAERMMPIVEDIREKLMKKAIEGSSNLTLVFIWDTAHVIHRTCWRRRQLADQAPNDDLAAIFISQSRAETKRLPELIVPESILMAYPSGTAANAVGAREEI